MRLDIELYKDGEGFGAWIADDCGGSGIEVNGNTPEELAENMKDYIADYCYNLVSED